VRHETSNHIQLRCGDDCGAGISVANCRRFIRAKRRCARSDVYRRLLLLQRDARRAETVAANTEQGPLTLDPKQFVGPVREAYKFAGKNPALLAQLHCYCGCDKAYGHQNLLDCYRGTHGATCEICTQESVASGADVGAGFAGRSDTRSDPQETSLPTN